jgi:hypothetical protein
MPLSFVFTTFLVLACSSAVFSQARTDSHLKAGTAKINISPVNLQNNRTVHDSLYARSLILQVQDTRIAFI